MDKIELIPVMEIWWSSDDFVCPVSGPYWMYPDEYAKANATCLVASGYEPMQSYTKGSGYYELSTVTDANLLLEIRKRTEGFQTEEVCPFDGGYILNINGKDMLFPQCCGDLSDIQYWKELADKEYKLFWQGHPQPFIRIQGDKIIMELDDEGLEDFVPPPSERLLTFDVNDLRAALETVIPKISVFASRIDKIAKANSLDIENPGNILVWGINP